LKEKRWGRPRSRDVKGETRKRSERKVRSRSRKRQEEYIK
jgi:hypothetical protein